MHASYAAYQIWKWLEQSRNTNKDGIDKANDNVRLMNLQSGFFHSAIKGIFYVFVIDLCTFFDKQRPAVSIDKIINALNVGPEDKEKIEGIRKEQESNISKLKTLRDKTVAHSDFEFDPDTLGMVMYAETEELFKAVQEIFNLLSKNHDRSFWVWDHLDPQIKGEMEWLFENLKRGEAVRLKEIEDEYQGMNQTN